MPYASNDDVRMFYEIVGTGPPLMLHVGYVGSVENWADAGYVAALQDRFQLILIDPRGQGRSDKPHQPEAYSRHCRIGDVVAVLDAVGGDRVHFWGIRWEPGSASSLALLCPIASGRSSLAALRPSRATPVPSKVTSGSSICGREWKPLLATGTTRTRISGFQPGSETGGWRQTLRR